MKFGTAVAIPEPTPVADGHGRGVDTTLLVALIGAALLIIAALGYGHRRVPRTRPHAVSTRTRRMVPPADDDEAAGGRPWQSIGTVYTTRHPIDRDQTMQLSAMTRPRHGR